METITSDTLNQSAMQMIMLAGDSRNLLTQAINEMLEGASDEVVDEKLKTAKEKMVAAHHIQTEMIQGSIEEDELQTTLLFSHAQDTLMTIYSELNMTGHLVRMHRQLSKQLN